jgi:subtilisin family serine protease
MLHRLFIFSLTVVLGVSHLSAQTHEFVTEEPISSFSNELKLSGLSPSLDTLSGSKVGIPVSSLLDSEWGMLASPGLGLKNAWDYLVKKKTIKASQTFDCSSSKIVVAIIDTGVDFKHKNLKDSAWINPKEVSGKSGSDDDRNGTVDDINGWDFTTNNASIVDGHGHGTHLAGIISGKSSESNGFKGVCPGVKIMSVRYFASDATGVKNLENTVKAIRYAVKSGANIINYSGGGASFAKEEFEALKEARDKGILVIAAAGNERNDTSVRPYFPASYDLNNIISVAAIGPEGKLIPASNWGGKTVSVAAPGGGILSLQQNQAYGFMNGTSQATAFVSGLSALVWSMNPQLTNLEVKQIIQKSIVKTAALKNKVIADGYVDAGLAVKIASDFKNKSKNQLKKASKLRALSGLQSVPSLQVKESL